jgi:hypothetical protein
MFTLNRTSRTAIFCAMVLLVLLIPAVYLGNKSAGKFTSATPQQPLQTETNKSELIPTQQETEEWSNLDRFKSSISGKANLLDVANAAYSGDRGALYWLGISSLVGGIEGMVIDVEAADIYFALSASLGFAPAVDKLRTKYRNEGNQFLSMIYINLCMSLGHTELLNLYYSMRDEITSWPGGQEIAKKIEVIAQGKMNKIVENRNNLQSSKCDNFVLSVLKRINGEDIIYDINYWIDRMEGNQQAIATRGLLG